MTVCLFHTMINSVLISVKPTGQFKIPNREVMVDWARWITGGVESYTDILDVCVEGHVSIFAERWPIFMQQHLDEDSRQDTRRCQFQDLREDLSSLLPWPHALPLTEELGSLYQAPSWGWLHQYSSCLEEEGLCCPD